MSTRSRDYTGASTRTMARWYGNDSSRYYAQARRDAAEAARFYELAAAERKHAAYLTACPRSWSPANGITPWQAEEYAGTLERLGDTYLRSSGWATEQARHYAGLYRIYTARADAEDARIAAWLAETSEAITRLRADAMAVRNGPLARLCSEALAGDALARGRVLDILHPMPATAKGGDQA